MIEPRRADGGKSLAPSPEIERLVEPRGQPFEKLGGLDRAAVVAPERRRSDSRPTPARGRN